jgi:hypothetical protein
MFAKPAILQPVMQPEPPASVPEPTSGGSYTRDPVTNALVRNPPVADPPPAPPNTAQE